MTLKKEARYIVPGRDRYKLEEKVPVYGENVSSNEILGYATVQKLENTKIKHLDGSITLHTDTMFILDDELIAKYPGFETLYNGLTNRLSIYDHQTHFENQKKEKIRKINKRKEQAKKSIFNHIVICENCDFSIGSSHEIKDVECPNCKEDGVLRDL